MWLYSECRDYPCALISYVFPVYLALLELSYMALQWLLGLLLCVHFVCISDVFSYVLAFLCSSTQGLDNCAIGAWCIVYSELAATPQSVHQISCVGSPGRVIVGELSPWWSVEGIWFKSVFEPCSTVFEGCVRVSPLKPGSCSSHSPN